VSFIVFVLRFVYYFNYRNSVRFEDHKILTASSSSSSSSTSMLFCILSSWSWQFNGRSFSTPMAFPLLLSPVSVYRPVVHDVISSKKVLETVTRNGQSTNRISASYVVANWRYCAHFAATGIGRFALDPGIAGAQSPLERQSRSAEQGRSTTHEHRASSEPSRSGRAGARRWDAGTPSPLPAAARRQPQRRADRRSASVK